MWQAGNAVSTARVYARTHGVASTEQREPKAFVVCSNAATPIRKSQNQSVRALLVS